MSRARSPVSVLQTNRIFNRGRSRSKAEPRRKEVSRSEGGRLESNQRRRVGKGKVRSSSSSSSSSSKRRRKEMQAARRTLALRAPFRVAQV